MPVSLKSFPQPEIQTSGAVIGKGNISSEIQLPFLVQQQPEPGAAGYALILLQTEFI